jgi:hypothetical protein
MSEWSRVVDENSSLEEELAEGRSVCCQACKSRLAPC